MEHQVGKKKSGAEGRKRVKESTEKNEELLKKIPKISSFFSTSASTSNVVEHSIPPPDTEAIASVPSSACAGVSLDDLVHEVGEVNPGVEFDVPDSDPARWIINENTREYLTKCGLNQNKDADFSSSLRVYSDKNRFMTKTLFQRQLLNGELINREWLVYSSSKGTVYCATCRLFNGKSNFALNDGFNDWKNAHDRLNAHEISLDHRNCTMKYSTRSNLLKRVDAKLALQLNEEILYWRSVLKRVVAVVKMLSTRGLAFRGKNETFGSPQNGIFLGSLELVAEFDPFLAEHISRFGNAGKGIPSYLSATICDEFIMLMGDTVRNEIIKELKIAKYYSISVDSTPDVSHVDQLTFIVRYVLPNGTPVERFLRFIPNPGHKSEQLETAVIDTLAMYNIHINDCRGQSYDNASNMSGAYTGLQARIIKLNALAVWVPCAAHSLNLVGTCAAESCKAAESFFSLLQRIYNFFSSSTHRWEILTNHLKFRQSVVKSLSLTRWSARGEACNALASAYPEIVSALMEFQNNSSEKVVARNEAEHIAKELGHLETSLMASFWNDVMERFNATSKKLQSVDIDVGSVVLLYASLEEYLVSVRENFDIYEQRAKEMSGLQDYALDNTRKARREALLTDKVMTGKDNYRINTFIVIIDCLLSELRKRKAAYKDLNAKFGFLSRLACMEVAEIITRATLLMKTYDHDIEHTFPEECVHFKGCLKVLDISETLSAVKMTQLLAEKKIETIYPNVNIALRIFTSTASANCSGERSFSTLKRVKNYSRSTMGQERLEALCQLAIESDIANTIPYDVIIDDFAERKARKKPL